MSRKTYPSAILGSRFLVADKTYGQYNSLYTARLSAMKAKLSMKARSLWTNPELQFADKIIECETSEGQECVLMGTVYKEMSLKPSVCSLTIRIQEGTWKLQVTFL